MPWPCMGTNLPAITLACSLKGIPPLTYRIMEGLTIEREI